MIDAEENGQCFGSGEVPETDHALVMLRIGSPRPRRLIDGTGLRPFGTSRETITAIPSV